MREQQQKTKHVGVALDWLAPPKGEWAFTGLGVEGEEDGLFQNLKTELTGNGALLLLQPV